MEISEKSRDVFVGDKFLYPVRGNACLTRCKVVNDGTRIGSQKCRGCEFMQNYSAEEKWITCSRIDEALGEFSLPVIKRKAEIDQQKK